MHGGGYLRSSNGLARCRWSRQRGGPALRLHAAVDEAGEARQRRGVDARGDGALQQQRDGADRLRRLPEGGTDLVAGGAGGEQLTGAAVARAGGEHGGDEVAGAGQAAEGDVIAARTVGQRLDLGEDLARGGARG